MSNSIRAITIYINIDRHSKQRGRERGKKLNRKKKKTKPLGRGIRKMYEY